jgi:hypothetical protein|tara:strand:+ start:72 stop:545 length:474 start_codon:yes stop_codon:yes gene_type:complete
MGGSQSKTTNTDAHLDNSSALKTSLPAPDGYFGDEKKYGGAYLPPPLEPVMKAVFDAYMQIKVDPAFLSELTRLRKEFIGRPSPIFHCKNLSDKYGGAQIYLKRPAAWSSCPAAQAATQRSAHLLAQWLIRARRSAIADSTALRRFHCLSTTPGART